MSEWNKVFWGGLAIIGVGLTIWYIRRDQQQQFIQPQQALDDLWKCKECGRQTWSCIPAEQNIYNCICYNPSCKSFNNVIQNIIA